MSKREKKLSVALQQPIIADYRMGLFRLLREKWGADFHIYAGDADFGGSPVSTPEAWRYFERVQNVYLLGQRFLWQIGCFKHLLEADVAILNANMRIVSNWVILLIRRLLGRPTIVWGHVEGQSRVAGRFRKCFLRLSNGFIAYTKSQANLLSARYPWLSTWVAANACISASDCVVADSQDQSHDSFLYVGRLVSRKKVSLLLEGYLIAKRRVLISERTRLVFVGDGEERELLEEQVASAGVQDRVYFAGHVSEIDELRAFYGRAICSVSPGYVGLSATQSFSFGVPMLVARDEFHSPEIEACRDGFNAYFFDSDSPEGLAEMLSRLEQGREACLDRRYEISAWTKKNYSFEAMRDAFIEAVEEVTSGV